MRETMELEWGLQRHIVANPVFVKKPIFVSSGMYTLKEVCLSNHVRASPAKSDRTRLCFVVSVRGL